MTKEREALRDILSEEAQEAIGIKKKRNSALLNKINEGLIEFEGIDLYEDEDVDTEEIEEDYDDDSGAVSFQFTDPDLAENVYNYALSMGLDEDDLAVGMYEGEEDEPEEVYYVNFGSHVTAGAPGIIEAIVGELEDMIEEFGFGEDVEALFEMNPWHDKGGLFSNPESIAQDKFRGTHSFGVGKTSALKKGKYPKGEMAKPAPKKVPCGRLARPAGAWNPKGKGTGNVRCYDGKDMVTGKRFRRKKSTVQRRARRAAAKK